MPPHTIQINRAPVLTLWAAVVAERLGHDRGAALTLGKAVAGANAQSKGRRLGIFEPPAPKGEKPKPAKRPAPAAHLVSLLGRSVAVVQTPKGPRATAKGAAITAESVERYLVSKFGSHLEEARAAMETLARSYPPNRLSEIGFALYEQFRPEIPEGVRGWGAKGELNLAQIRSLGKSARQG